MDFHQFQQTREHHVDMSEVCAASGPGYVYAYGANIEILAAGAGYAVNLDRGDFGFESLEDAELFLYENFVLPECIYWDDTLSVEDK